jgi:hypothetical protein
MRGPTEEVLVFARPAAFGLIVGAVYWFVAYEPAGTVLLVGFGAASALASVLLWAGSQRESTESADDPAVADSPEGPEGPFGEALGRVPAPAYAPLIVGIGTAVGALGLALGPLLMLTGFVILVIGCRYWLEAVMRQAEAGALEERQ